MSKNSQISMEHIEKQPLATFTERAYLDYSMYVILDRALPSICDGLKPVQRRLVYAMSELGLKNTAKFKKSARTIGDVLGKYHPHGEVACYEAMVLMAQAFTYRYPLVDGQGNWGSPDDPKSFAAMRYTEARLAAYAETLLVELGQGTVDWGPNFDGTMDEPKVLPARLPNVLLNGGMGIAVGMATDIPPHNLIEVVDACVHVLDNPGASTKACCTIIQGPDYPTEAEIITPRADIAQMYEKGSGTIKMRAVYQVDQGDIVITALPHQVSGAKILEQIASQMQVKKLPMVVDLRDESDHENPTRLVIVPRSNRVDVESLMLHLFSTTDLERNYRVNLNMIGVDGRPQVKNLAQILKEWLAFRKETTKKRLHFRLDKVTARLHILDGLLIAFLSIDEVIAIIRSEDDPKVVLMQRFDLSEKQTDAILDLKLRHLAKLEEVKIRSEQSELRSERDTLEKTLASTRLLNSLMRKELKALRKTYGDARRSPIVKRSEAHAMSTVQTLPSEPVTVVLSSKGWVRAAKGHEVDGQSLSYKAGDSYLAKAMGRSNQMAVFIDSTGRTYSIMAHGLPSARGQGEPLTGRVSPPSGATFCGVMMGDDKAQVLLASDLGYGFIAQLGDLIVKSRSGKQVLKVPKGAGVLMPVRVVDITTARVAVLTCQGRLLIFPATQLSIMARGKGTKLIQIDSGDFDAQRDKVIGLAILEEKTKLTVLAGRRTLILSSKDQQHYMSERARRGAKLPRGYQKATGLA